MNLDRVAAAVIEERLQLHLRFITVQREVSLSECFVDFGALGPASYQFTHSDSEGLSVFLRRGTAAKPSGIGLGNIVTQKFTHEVVHEAVRVKPGSRQKPVTGNEARASRLGPPLLEPLDLARCDRFGGLRTAGRVGLVGRGVLATAYQQAECEAPGWDSQVRYDGALVGSHELGPMDIPDRFVRMCRSCAFTTRPSWVRLIESRPFPIILDRQES